MASLEFCVPSGPRGGGHCGGRRGGRTPGWYCRPADCLPAGRPGSGRPVPRPEHLGALPAISRRLDGLRLGEGGMTNVRTRVMSLGGGLVMWGTAPMTDPPIPHAARTPRTPRTAPPLPRHFHRQPSPSPSPAPAWRRAGVRCIAAAGVLRGAVRGWRDWWTLLHPPYNRVAPVVLGDRRGTGTPSTDEPAGRDGAGVLPRGGTGGARYG